MVERYIFGWKEIEFEVMRDSAGSAITICSMENFDPVGVHTGDSIVVAPALTLADKGVPDAALGRAEDYRRAGHRGRCNCQFALNPDSFEYAVIEVNPRVSRSSALASKATGYPIAKVSAKIALGYTLDEIKNEVTGETYACFEPALDYVVVKLPRWPFDKFYGADRSLGPADEGHRRGHGHRPHFRGRAYEGDTRRRHQGGEPQPPRPAKKPLQSACARLTTPACSRSSRPSSQGYSLEELHSLTCVDMFFLTKLQNMARLEASLARGLTPENVKLAANTATQRP